MSYYTSEIPDYADVFTIEEWWANINCGAFTDWDGSGCPVKDGKMANETFFPSDAADLPVDATHIAWFNK